MNTKSSLVEQLKDKAYRDAFVASQVRIGLPMQVRALRESREWTQPQLAEKANMSQPRISEIERSGERKLNLETLLRLASAFDVALQVRFIPFSTLVDDDECIDLDNFTVDAFDEDIARLEKLEERMKSVHVMKRASVMDEMVSVDQNLANSLAVDDSPTNNAPRQDGVAKALKDAGKKRSATLSGGTDETISRLAS